jgi:hypothetical protein
MADYGESISFPAQVAKCQTLADSGLRITFDLPESEIVAFAWLAGCKRDGVIFTVTCQPEQRREDERT